MRRRPRVINDNIIRALTTARRHTTRIRVHASLVLYVLLENYFFIYLFSACSKISRYSRHNNARVRARFFRPATRLKCHVRVRNNAYRPHERINARFDKSHPKPLPAATSSTDGGGHYCYCDYYRGVYINNYHRCIRDAE